MRIWKYLLVATLFVSTACTAPGSGTPAGAGESGVPKVEGRGSGKARWWDQLPRPQWQEYTRLLPGEAWFEVYRVRPGVIALYEPGQFEEVISFLVLGERRAVLFDTGLGVARLRPLVERLTELPVTVINSHSHYDHVGGNREFDRVAALANDYSRNRSKGLDNATVGDYLRGEWVWKPLPGGTLPETYAIPPYRITRALRDGEVIDLGGRQLEVIATPGHSPDSLCLLDRQNRLLFTGDTFYLAPLYAHLPGSDVAAYRRSARRLALLEPQVDALLTAHNVPVADAAWLGRMREAFAQVVRGEGDYVATDGAREYDFGGFSIIIP